MIRQQALTPATLRPLPRRFYARGAVAVARDLLGRLLVHWSAEGVTAGLIVEAEAYDQTDPASHCYSGLTERNRAMFGPGGHVYVYRSYGIHWCMNLVTGRAGHGAAVLLRALEPFAGLALMRSRRGDDKPAPQLARGPGSLCAAMGITSEHYGLDVTGGPLWVANPPGRFRRPDLLATPRIGISRATEQPWRFCIPGNPFVSGPRRWR